MYRSVEIVQTSTTLVFLSKWFSSQAQFTLQSKMVATLICLMSCSFARTTALEIVKETTQMFCWENGEGRAKFRVCSMQECYKRFTGIFKERSEEFAIDFLKFQKKIPAL